MAPSRWRMHRTVGFETSLLHYQLASAQPFDQEHHEQMDHATRSTKPPTAAPISVLSDSARSEKSELTERTQGTALMIYDPNDTYCVCQALTPRVRTIFRPRQAAATPPSPAPQPSKGAAHENAEKKEPGWHGLICEILESLFPFPEAYTVVRNTLDAFGAKLPSPA